MAESVGDADVNRVGIGSRYDRHAIAAARNACIEGVAIHPTRSRGDRQRGIVRNHVVVTAIAEQAVGNALRRIGGVDQIAARRTRVPTTVPGAVALVLPVIATV